MSGPQHEAGISTSRTWWSQRWVSVLDDLGPEHSRQLQQGQALARRGAVEQVRLDRGRITGAVVDDQPRPSSVELRWAPAPVAAWQRVVAELAEEIRFVAALLEGELPEEATGLFARAGVPLVPDVDDVASSCSCRAPQRPCRHAVALWSAAAAILDRDVFALLRLRGRDAPGLLEDLRAQRGTTVTEPVGAGLDLSQGLFAAHGDLGEIGLHPAPVEDPAALFRQLGEPPGVADTAHLESLVARAAATAWRLAAGEGAQVADEELLLAELRAQRVATPGSLAEALGRDAEAVRDELDRLFSDGAVMRTGAGEGARYRAAAS